MFTLLFGIIRGFFKLIGGFISFIIGGILLVVLCIFFARSCSNSSYDAYRLGRGTPNHVEYDYSQTYYQQQNIMYNTPQSQSYPPKKATNPKYDHNRLNDASHMFKEYHFNHQLNAGEYVACPVCHRQFCKNSVDNCFCTDECWRRYNDIVNAWNRGDAYEVERLGKNFR
jgi:hypothetical protein